MSESLSVREINVGLDFGGAVTHVGRLAMRERRIYFEYHPDFIAQGLELSPYHLPLKTGVTSFDLSLFEGLPGVFNDSLPDGWGRLLLDRKLIELGENPKEISTLDRLSFLGKNAMGALIYEPITETSNHQISGIDLDLIAKESALILNEGSAHFLDELYHLGGNSVGARPKIVVNLDPISEEFHLNATENSTPWIVKFPALNDYQDIAKIEHAYSLMAKHCGIEMSDSQLFISASGKSFFGTKRFDFDGLKRLHLHSACGLLHDNFRFSTLDYGHVMDAANKLENNILACEKVFRLAVFNVYALNMDDHSKNIAFLMDENGIWKLAPAFDLTFSPSPGSFQSLSVANSYQKVADSDLLRLGKLFGIERCERIIEEVKSTLTNWDEFAADLEINSKIQKLVYKSIQEKIKH
jgi:serine/threonine-protein kinase HipA